MSSKSKIRELEGMKNETGSISSWGDESKHRLYCANSHLALVDDVQHLNAHLHQDQTSTGTRGIQLVQWETLPPELLLDIIWRVEENKTFWPARAAVIYCASVCKSWRSVTKEIIQNLQQSGKITFPISLKQVINSSSTLWSN
ncbi:hypothetical protein TSUD_194010 [Trifolium subterraneum]|uniref:F-box domain-containing protein n=1 Tax=Trifolium subterraneum TaxID=3900 RepID=A0A2Z6LMU9_TRISU|nr:hypothetical protein TSUD_194010 [Trifolium subterraneum]